MPARRAIAAYLLLVLTLCVTVALGDEIVGLSTMSLPFGARSAAPSRPAGRPWHEGRPRVFAVLADSLRYRTAIDPDRMPALAKMLPRGARAKVTTTRDAVTVPAIRAALRGEERTELFGFVTSLFRGRAAVTSLLSDLRADGRSAVAYSDGSFLQFGDDVTELSNEGSGKREADRQNDRARRAAAEFAAGKGDLVIVHLTYTDHVAHEHGVGHPVYAEHYRALDDLFAELDRVIAPEDTLVLFGDHGHDDQGRHSMGLDVPTFAFYRGPGFRAGADMGTIHLTDHRWLLGWALELPLPEAYRGGRHTGAIAARGGSPPEEYARSPFSFSKRNARLRDAFQSRGLVIGAAQWVLAMLVAGACGAALVGIARVASPGLSPPRKTHGRVAVAAVALVAWGALLARLRPIVHEPPILAIAGTWVAIAAAVVIALRRGPAWAPYAVIALLAAPLFLLHPTVYRYGAPAAMGPVWMCGVIAIVAAAPPPRRGRVAAVGALLLLFPFKLAEASDFRALGFISWPVQAIPGTWATVDLVALLVLFVRRGPIVSALLGVAAAVLIYGLHLHEIGLGRYDALVAAGLGLAALGLRVLLGRRRAAAAPEAEVVLVASVERTLGLAALLVGFHALVLARPSMFAAADVLLAALCLSAPLVEGLPERASRWAFALLALLAVLAAGWVTLAWTVHGFEWSALYQWLSGAFVEKHIGWLMPVILIRYAVPLRAARRLLLEGAPRAAERAGPLVFTLVAAKAASLALILLGIGLVEATSDSYLEAAQETAIWLVVMIGIL